MVVLARHDANLPSKEVRIKPGTVQSCLLLVESAEEHVAQSGDAVVVDVPEFVGIWFGWVIGGKAMLQLARVANDDVGDGEEV